MTNEDMRGFQEAVNDGLTNKWIFETRLDFSVWLIGVSWNTGEPDSYWGNLKYFRINVLCVSFQIYKYVQTKV